MQIKCLSDNKHTNSNKVGPTRQIQISLLKQQQQQDESLRQ